jgi:hypothetical protein
MPTPESAVYRQRTFGKIEIDLVGPEGFEPPAKGL